MFLLGKGKVTGEEEGSCRVSILSCRLQEAVRHFQAKGVLLAPRLLVLLTLPATYWLDR